MIIKGIAASLPERRVGNEEVIDHIRRHSAKGFSGDLERTLRIIRHVLKRTGLIERRVCDRHDTPIDHVAVAVREAMSHCYLRRQHIDLLLYVGVGRGFIEPGNSHMIASALGFHNAQCFDVVDACMSWLRALDMVDSYFKTGKYRNALIINAEFHTMDSGPHYPACLTLKSADEIPYRFPSYTIGDAATATVLYPKDPENFEADFTTKPELANLCTLPLEGFEEFCHLEPEIGKNGVMQFTAYGEELHRHVEIESKLLFNSVPNSRDVDVLFVHASSFTEWDKHARAVGMGDKVFHIYPHTGNIVSASIPAAMSMAEAQGRLKRGDRVGVWVASAGMSFGYSRFRY